MVSRVQEDDHIPCLGCELWAIRYEQSSPIGNAHIQNFLHFLCTSALMCIEISNFYTHQVGILIHARPLAARIAECRSI